MKSIERNDFLNTTLDTFLENSNDMIFIKDVDLIYVSASTGFVKLVNAPSRESLIGKCDADIFGKELSDLYISADKKVLVSGMPKLDFVEPIPSEDGKRRYSSTSKYPIMNKQRQIIGLYGIARDVTAEIELEEERERTALSREMFDDILEADISENRLIKSSGSVLANILSKDDFCTFSDAVEILATKFADPDYADEIRNLYDREKLQEDFRKGINEFSHVVFQRRENDNYKWVEFTSRIYFSKISNTLKITTFLRDLDEEIKIRERLKQIARRDALTGLLNRRTVMEEISKHIACCNDSDSYVLMFVDLDYFKQVNDTLGHLAGDGILINAANTLTDFFDEGTVIGRVGGDEFVILLKNTYEHNITEISFTLLKSIVSHTTSLISNRGITCSVGAAVAKGNNLSAEELYERADKAMYKAKESGRNSVVLY